MNWTCPIWRMIIQSPWENVILITKCSTGCWCGKMGRKQRVILSCCIFGQNGAVQIEHLYEEECKTAQAGSGLQWWYMHHDPWLVTRLLVKRVMKKHIAQPMGWMVVKNFELILFDPNCLIGTMFLGPENWCQIAVLLSLLLEAPSC